MVSISLKNITKTFGDVVANDKVNVEIEEGEILSDRNIALLRSEKNLSPGIASEFFATIKGKRATRRIPDGKGIEWDDLLTER